MPLFDRIRLLLLLPLLNELLLCGAYLTSSRVNNHKNRCLTCRSATSSLWDRLGLEEDEQPMWYVLNCVAGNEMDLLNQCRVACADSGDVIKFVVPTVSSVRSHGANRMVNDVKVRYPGYVFAKLRLCKSVYETIQRLDLCRSWMGTVNHRGYKKLPPAPLALNAEEIAKFGLEEIANEVNTLQTVDEENDGVIVDLAEGEMDKDDATFIDPRELKVYQGLKVEDMVKVTAQNKFFNEDGIVRRLKGGKILVRFYTYGTMFEEWLEPSHVRKLSSMEILQGLAGPSQPITQRDFDGGGRGRAGTSSDSSYSDNMFQQTFGGAGAPQHRNRRQDRTANRYKNRDMLFGEERRRDECNWNWYKEQQQQQQSSTARGSGNTRFGDSSGSAQAGEPFDDDDALSDVASQWGRNKSSQRQQRRDSNNRVENRRPQAAIDGQADWSAFVSAPSKRASSNDGMATRESTSSDDFFDSLMDTLSKDLNTGDETSYRSRTQQQPLNTKRQGSHYDNDEDDFFASLMSDLTTNDATSNKRQEESTTTRAKSGDTRASSDDADDFFTSIFSDIPSSEEDATSSSNREVTTATSKVPILHDDDDGEDFFASLEAELGNAFEDDLDDFGGGGGGGGVMLDAVDKPASAKQTDSPSSSKKLKKPAISSSSSSQALPHDLDRCTVPVLKELLRERGLKVTGKKSELIERLVSL